MGLSMKRDVRVPWTLSLFLAAVFAVKLLVVWQLKDHPLLHPDAGLDTTAYVHLARRVVAGDLALGPGLYFVSPLYIYFLAAGLALFDSFTAVRVLQIGLGTASVGCIFVMARAWFGTRAAWMAALLAASMGLFTFYEALILQSSIDAFLTSAALAALAWGLRIRRRAKREAGALLLSGLMFGLATLNRPNMLFGAAAVVAASFVLRRWRPGVLVIVGLAAGLAPCAVRNVVVAREWSVVSSHGGLNLYIGNNENATGFYREVPGIRPLIEGQQEDTRHVASQALGREVSDAEASQYFTRQATTWIREHPLAAARLFARKLFYTFHAQHVPLPHSYPFFAYDTGSVLRFFVIGPWLIVPLGLVGLVFAARGDPLRLEPGAESRSRDVLIWIAFLPGYAIGVAVFFVAERYRLPLFVPLSIGAGAAIDLFWRACASRRFPRLVAPAATLAVLAVAVNWPLPFLNDGRWDDGLRTAQRLVITGDYDAADAWVERLERNAPRAGRAHHGVGMQLAVRDQLGRALPHLKKSLELGFASKDDAEVWLRVGRLSARTEGPAAAEPLFRRAAQLAPDRPAARQQYGLNLVLLGRLDEASRELREAVRLDSADADSLAYLAYCEIKLGHLADAREHLRRALAVKPDDPFARQLAAAIPR